ncbi:MAG: hypothetical protein IPO52_15035 [Gemmatimonadetes bacterium]|nr:hypothetical protein [Gemmatimonadota bacterium]
MLRRATFALLLAGCGNAGESLTFPALPEGGIAVSFYLDRDATGTYTTNDTTMAGVRVALLAANGVDTIQTVLSSATGVAIFGPVPIGRYRVVVDRAALGDSIGVVVGDTGTITILARQDSNTATRLVRLGFEEVTVAQARALPAGRRVIVRGIVLSPMQAFRDSTMFLQDVTGAPCGSRRPGIGRDGTGTTSATRSRCSERRGPRWVGRSCSRGGSVRWGWGPRRRRSWSPWRKSGRRRVARSTRPSCRSPMRRWWTPPRSPSTCA